LECYWLSFFSILAKCRAERPLVTKLNIVAPWYFICWLYWSYFFLFPGHSVNR